MTTGNSALGTLPDPYVVPDAVDNVAPVGSIFETEIIAAPTTVDIGGTSMNAETYNATIPGPTLRLTRGDEVAVRLINRLPYPTGIHWHGIELSNSSDGTPFTQDGAVPAHAVPPFGGTYLYKFKVPRAGIYWYHPHHHHSTNRVFRGLYGMIIVTDPIESDLIAANLIPSTANTVQLVLSDVTVCKALGSHDPTTFDLTLPWVGGAILPNQPPPRPGDLCEFDPLTDDGATGGAAFGAGDVPNIQRAGPGRTNEGQTVLTNGVNVGGRAGAPGAPLGALEAGAHLHDVAPGQGLRLQVVNCATVRYFRLLLTRQDGTSVQLFRIGGEGGILDAAILEGTTPAFDFKHPEGEILIPPASRADIVAMIPNVPGTVLTLWTQDFPRTGSGAGFSQIPTVPVMHLNVTGPLQTYTITSGMALRSAVGAPPVGQLPDGPFDSVLDPAAFSKPGTTGTLAERSDIRLTAISNTLGINGVVGSTSVAGPYAMATHIGSARYAQPGDLLELKVTNTSGAHHPFHLHGFSFQPKRLVDSGGATYDWPYDEFRDNLDVPSNSELTFRVRLDPRELKDGTTMSGAFGRWLFHCHIFFHAHQGMISELVVTDATGGEKPNVDVGGSWAYTAIPGVAFRRGTFSHIDGAAVSLAASFGNLTVDAAAGTWEWTFDATAAAPQIRYVYVTATDAAGRQDQAVFRLKVGAPDDGADSGDPHVYTVDGKRYDFQAVGEFTLLTGEDGMEIQARQTPVPSATPITDSYSGLKSCVSVNTAVAARVGRHRIAYQPTREPGELRLYLDGKPTHLPGEEGIDLGMHRLTSYAVPGGGQALRVDFDNQAVLTITPYFWSSNGIWLMNISITRTSADAGIMGSIPKTSWLPKLPNGATVGPMPTSLGERYVQLYRAFADAWRVTDESSLFVYERGASTATFTDREWPAEQPPCKLKPQFQPPDGPTAPKPISIEKARAICKGVTMADLHGDCVFDVATTGDEVFALGYALAQDLRLNGTAVQITCDRSRSKCGDIVMLTAIVAALGPCRPTPTGCVTFLVDDKPVGPPVKLSNGRARLKIDSLKAGNRKLRARYQCTRKRALFQPSQSPTITCSVLPR